MHLCDNFHTRTWHVGVRNSASVWQFSHCRRENFCVYAFVWQFSHSHLACRSLRFYESSVLMRFLFLSSFSAFLCICLVVQQRGSNRVRIRFESDSNRIRTGIIFNFLWVAAAGVFFNVGWDATRFCQPIKANCFYCFFRRKRKVAWRGFELTRFRKRAAQSASPRLVPWAKMATVKDWECTMVHTSRRTQAHFLLHPVEVEKS